MSREVSTRRLIAAALLLALGFTSLTQIGCTRPVRRLGILDELAIAYRDRVWAQRAYNLRFANCNRQYEDHFKNGFCAGYSDVCNGGDGYVPALPPENYRGFEYQCAEGSKCVDAWFDGYPEGVAAARAEDAGTYQKMYVSRMIDKAITQDTTPNNLPADIPVNKATDAMTPLQTAAMKIASVTKPTEVSQKPVKPVVAKAKETLPAKPHSIYTAPQTARPDRTATLPPIARPPVKQPAAKLPPIVQGVAASTSTQAIVPPIVPGNTMTKATVATMRPPVVRGQKIDPAANVTRSEIPLPMAVRSTFETRTAAWPVNRK